MYDKINVKQVYHFKYDNSFIDDEKNNFNLRM